MTGTGDESGLWQAMLRLYAVPGVAAACLRLQDGCGVDVPLLLACLHAAGQGRAIGAAEVERLDQACASWRAEVTQPLRRIRRRMKRDERMQAFGPAARLREEIKALELRSERVQATLLWQALESLPPPHPAGGWAGGAARRCAAEAAVAHFCGGVPGPSAREDLEILVEADQSLASD